jgi:TatD DNase family protein
MYIDCHCHLDICKNSNNTAKSAKKKNVEIVTVGVDINTNRKALDLARRHENVKAMLGVYPSEGVKLIDEDIEKEIEFIRKNKNNIIGVGEVGLDLKELSDLGRQEEIFRKMISLSLELDIPIIVHSRMAEKESIEILEEMKAKKVIMHCFSGSFKLVKRIVENDWYLSIPSSVKYNEHFQKIAKEIEIDKLLCETDSPFLHPDKKKDNLPENVIESYKKISEIKKIDLKKVEKPLKIFFYFLFNFF